MILEKLADPLAPHGAVALASTCSGLRATTTAALAELRGRREAVLVLCDKERRGAHRTAVRDAKELFWNYTDLTSADTAAFVSMVEGGMLRLATLDLGNNPLIGDEGVQTLARGLRGRSLPSLHELALDETGMGDKGAVALAGALCSDSLFSLKNLFLNRNKIGDAGLVALAAPLRKHSALDMLVLNDNNIGDEGATTLVAPGEGVLPKLRFLHVSSNKLGTLAFASIVAALDSGMMPLLGFSCVPGTLALDVSLNLAATEKARVALGRACQRRNLHHVSL